MCVSYNPIEPSYGLIFADADHHQYLRDPDVSPFVGETRETLEIINNSKLMLKLIC